MKKIIMPTIIILMIFLILPGCNINSKVYNKDDGNSKTSQSANPPEGDTENPKQNTQSDPIKDQIDKMTLDEKIGQMIMSGVDGYTISDNTIKMIKNYHVGGFIILGENIKNANQLLNLINSLKTADADKIPLFLSIDQEGGRIDRMPPEFKRLLANESVGKVNNSEFSYEIGSIISEELNLFGFNMDFAPVLDINSNPKNPVIGDRSFGSNSDIVTKLGIQTMKGIESGNIISVVKHFPGHGDTSVDSHVGLPLVNNNIERLKSFELIPFTQAIRNDVDAVMVAHILLPKIDSKYPASMSKTIITDILRNDLKFDGIVITDDMTMGAVVKNYNIGDAAVKSVNAGSDIILVCHGYNNESAVVDALKKAVQNGTITEERINQSVYRILKLKQKYNISNKIIKSISVNSINNKINNVIKKYIK